MGASAQQPAGFAVQLPPPGMHAPPSVGGGVVTTCCVHCAEWLCVVMSWNGSQNAGYDGSPLPDTSADDRLIAAIQICGCWQLPANGIECGCPGSSAESAG